VGIGYFYFYYCHIIYSKSTSQLLL